MTEKEVSGLRRAKRANTLTSIGDVVHDALPPEEPEDPGRGVYLCGDGYIAICRDDVPRWSVHRISDGASVSWGDWETSMKGTLWAKNIRRLDLSSQPPDDVDVVEGFVNEEGANRLRLGIAETVYPEKLARPHVSVQLFILRAKS